MYSLSLLSHWPCGKDKKEEGHQEERAPVLTAVDKLSAYFKRKWRPKTVWNQGKAPCPNLMRQNVWRANSLLHQTLLVKYCCGDLRRVVARSTTSRMFCNSPLATVSCSCTGDCTVVYSIEEDCHPAHYFDYVLTLSGILYCVSLFAFLVRYVKRWSRRTISWKSD